MPTEKLTSHFTAKEMECGCDCREVSMNTDFMKKLESARVHADTPFKINSGFRCKEHNKAVGGKPTSAHLTGQAADIVATTSRERHKILFSLVSIGFNRIGIAKKFIHADSDQTKYNRVIWLY
jgi:zinc D-Ala-D-Ala carboxypeptidase